MESVAMDQAGCKEKTVWLMPVESEEKPPYQKLKKQ